MYGNKQFSSSFPIDEFIAYVGGRYTFPPLPAFVEYTARCRADIVAILAEKRRAFYFAEGTLSFRGQTRQHMFRRRVPNPVRADSSGREISLFHGIYRQATDYYSFRKAVQEQRTLEDLLGELEPNNPDVFFASSQAFDVMRTEQHYATHTRGLDISFDIGTALFFSTHRYVPDDGNGAQYETTQPGDYTGVIYCFRFRDPPVKKTQYLIVDFDLFRTYRPERILRQECGLPLIGNDERNIALTDLDCIIQLDRDFDCKDIRTPTHYFPPASADPFYGRLLELKDKYPDELRNIVEYQWARQ